MSCVMRMCLCLPLSHEWVKGLIGYVQFPKAQTVQKKQRRQNEMPLASNIFTLMTNIYIHYQSHLVVNKFTNAINVGPIGASTFVTCIPDDSARVVPIFKIAIGLSLWSAACLTNR